MANLCDCSGYVAWVLWLSRVKKPSRPWDIWTNAIHRDATGKQTVFKKLPGPEPGAIVVYPGFALGKLWHYGHTGVVTMVTWSGDFNVIDCASGPSKRLGRAINERDGKFFLNNSKTVFCALNQDVKA